MDAITGPIAPAIASARAIDELIAALAARQHDRVARWQLLASGVSEDAITHRLRNGRLRKVRPGVYQLGAARPTRRARWMQDVLACGRGARLGGTSVLELLDIRRPSNRRTVVVTAKRGRRAPRGIDLRTSRHDGLKVWDGIPISPLPRALAEAARDLDDEQLEAAYEKAVVTWGMPPDLVPRNNGRLNRLMEDHRRGTALTDSDLENLFRAIVKRAGLPMPESNRDVWTGERFYRPDFLWPEQRLVVEIDGDVHDGQRQRDDRRAAHLAALGYTPLRFSRLQLIRHQDEITAALRPFL